MRSDLSRLGYAALTASVLLSSGSSTQSADFYVSPIGSDANAGTLAAPWQSVLTGVVRSQPGDTVFLRGGTYTEGEIWIQQKAWGGTPGHFKTVRNYPGESPSLGGTRRLINQADWIRFEGLQFRLDYTFDNNSGDHVEIRNCRFEGPQPSYGAISFSGNHGLIEGNTIKITEDNNNTLDHGMYLLHGTDNVVRGNVVSGSSGYGIHIYDEHKSEDPPGYVRRFDRIRIEQNFVEASRHRSGIIATVSDTASMSNIVIRGNILTSNNHVGLVVGNVRGVLVENNTFFNNGRQALYISANATNASIRSNIFVQTSVTACTENCSWFGIRHIGLENPALSLEVAGNCYQPTNVPSDGPVDQTAIFGDPNFINPSARDFRLNLASPLCLGLTTAEPSGAMPCGSMIRISGVERDSDHGMLRFRVTGTPATLMGLETSSGLLSGNWSNTLMSVEASPVGAFLAVPLGELPQSKFYRAVSAISQGTAP